MTPGALVPISTRQSGGRDDPLLQFSHLRHFLNLRFSVHNLRSLIHCHNFLKIPTKFLDFFFATNEKKLFVFGWEVDFKEAIVETFLYRIFGGARAPPEREKRVGKEKVKMALERQPKQPSRHPDPTSSIKLPPRVDPTSQNNLLL